MKATFISKMDEQKQGEHVHQPAKEQKSSWEHFLEQKSTLIAFAVILLAFYLRFKFMNVNTGLWWDEADYLGLAKKFWLGIPHEAASWRAYGSGLVLGFFYYIGAGEWMVRFVGVIISTLGVYSAYLFGKQFYNKFVGIVAAALMSAAWIDLFWSARISMNIYALTMWAFSAYFFWRGYVENRGMKYVIAAAAIAAYGIFVYESIGFIYIFFFLYLILTERLSFFKDKRIWIALLVTAIIFSGFFAYNLKTFGNIYPRIFTHYNTLLLSKDVKQNELQIKLAQGYNYKGVLADFFVFWTKMPELLTWPVFAMVILGLAYFVDIFLGFDLFLKKKASLEMKKNLYIFLWVLVHLVIFGLHKVFTTMYYEPLYIIPMIPGLYIIAGLGVYKGYELVSKYHKLAAMVFVAAIVIFAFNTQYTYAKNLINSKKDTYAMQREAGEWLKANTIKGDVVGGCLMGVPFSYYSERAIKGVAGTNYTLFMDKVKKYHPKFVVLDVYEPSGCPFNEVLSQQEMFKPVQVFFLNGNQQQPVEIILQPNYDAAELKN